MARMPGAVWQGEHGSRRMDHYDIVCMHTIVGYAPAHAAHFSVKGNGVILQSRDTKYQSAANLYGNPRIIAIENEDHGPAFPDWSGSNVPPLTDAQVEANAKILQWVHETHGVPLQLCPDSRPESRGLAYHRQGIDGNWAGYAFPGRVPGGEVWTLARGKVCPGDRRIAQRPKVLRLAIELDKRKGYFNMELSKEDLKQAIRDVLNEPTILGNDGNLRGIPAALRRMQVEHTAIVNEINQGEKNILAELTDDDDKE